LFRPYNAGQATHDFIVDLFFSFRKPLSYLALPKTTLKLWWPTTTHGKTFRPV